jgi:putative addiction module antidote
MQRLKVRKIGNSLGVVLPRDVLARLGVGEGDELILTDAPEGDVRISRADDEFARDMEAAEAIMERYRNTLAELAK